MRQMRDELWLRIPDIKFSDTGTMIALYLPIVDNPAGEEGLTKEKNRDELCWQVSPYLLMYTRSRVHNYELSRAQ